MISLRLTALSGIPKSTHKMHRPAANLSDVESLYDENTLTSCAIDLRGEDGLAAGRLSSSSGVSCEELEQMLSTLITSHRTKFAMMEEMPNTAGSRWMPGQKTTPVRKHIIIFHMCRLVMKCIQMYSDPSNVK